MNKDSKAYLLDILDNTQLIYQFIADGEDWDEKTRYAVERAISIIGEAAKHIDTNTQLAISEVEWQKIKGARNLVVHQYETVNPFILKDICANHLKPLESAIKQYLDLNQ